MTFKNTLFINKKLYINLGGLSSFYSTEDTLFFVVAGIKYTYTNAAITLEDPQDNPWTLEKEQFIKLRDILTSHFATIPTLIEI